MVVDGVQLAFARSSSYQQNITLLVLRVEKRRGEERRKFCTWEPLPVKHDANERVKLDRWSRHLVPPHFYVSLRCTR